MPAFKELYSRTGRRHGDSKSARGTEEWTVRSWVDSLIHLCVTLSDIRL